MRLNRSESATHFHELPGEHKTRDDKITLTLLEETPSGPYWDVRVKSGKDFSLISDELIINLGHKKPAIRFTKDGMSTVCPKCCGVVRYGVQGDLPNWWCEECGHHKLDEGTSSPSIAKAQELIH